MSGFSSCAARRTIVGRRSVSTAPDSFSGRSLNVEGPRAMPGRAKEIQIRERKLSRKLQISNLGRRLAGRIVSQVFRPDGSSFTGRSGRAQGQLARRRLTVRQDRSHARPPRCRLSPYSSIPSLRFSSSELSRGCFSTVLDCPRSSLSRSTGNGTGGKPNNPGYEEPPGSMPSSLRTRLLSRQSPRTLTWRPK